MRIHDWIMIALAAVLIIAPLAQAAQDAGICPEIVQQALSDLGQNCDALDRNSACYGYNRVGATFNEPQTDDFFSEVSDRSFLNVIDTLTTAPLDEAEGIWGVAVMKVQANVPNSLPGQAVSFVLLGDAEVRNEVPPDQAFTPIDPIEITAVGNVNIRSGPGRNANVITSVTNGTTLLADARNPDSSWVRVVVNNTPGWASAELVNAPEGLGGLPAISAETRTPMQSFYLTTGPGDLSCNEAPDVLLVQGPENFKVDLTVNGADIQIGSTIALRSILISYGDLRNNKKLIEEFGGSITDQNANDTDQCSITQIFVIDGEADLNKGIVTLPTGFTADAVNCGGPDLTSGFTTPWAGSRPLSPEDLEFLQSLGNLPPNILNYPVRIPTLADIQEILSQLGGSTVGNVILGPAAGQADCANFKPTSPLGGMPAGNVNFYWDPTPGATSYTVQVYDSTGTQVAEYPVSAPQTSVSGTPSGEGNMSWDVTAYVNGEVACTTGKANVLRDQVYNVPAGPSGPQYTVTCVSFGTCFTPCAVTGTCGFKIDECTCPA